MLTDGDDRGAAELAGAASETGSAVRVDHLGAGSNRQPLSHFTDVDGSQPDAWRYLIEVQDAGEPADTTGYR
jgi:hypothetical protein